MDETKLYPKVFTWLFAGLLITFLSGYLLSMNPEILRSMLPFMWVIVIVELGIAILFGVRIRKMSKITAIICYLIYSLTTGLTFGILFLAYELSSIIMIFGVTAGLFALFAAYGYFTKRDLTRWSTFLFMALIGIIISTLINMFIGNSTFDMIICGVAIIIFLGYIAYDMQKVKLLAEELGEDKGAIYSAFQLYLDFINLFIRLLELFGKRND